MGQNAEFTIVQVVYLDETGDSAYRMRWPGQILAGQTPNWRVLNVHAGSVDRFQLAESADLLVVFQSSSTELLPLMERRRKKGLKTLVEYNDNFYFPHPESPVVQAWSSPLTWQTYEHFMSLSDGVIVTSLELRETLASRVPNANFHILRNQLPYKLDPFDSVFTPPEETVNIGWAGSVGHMSDLLSLLPIFNNLIENPKVRLHFMGNESIPKCLGLPSESITFRRWGSMAEYYEFLAPLHIGLAPLRNTPYNNCRSDVKALEYSSRGVLPLLTEAPPYKDFLEATGIKACRSFDEFLSLLNSYIEDHEALARDVKSCYDYVAENRMAASNLERLDLYRSYLPKYAVEFNWPHPLGYHEYTGKIEEKPINTVILQNVQDSINKGDRVRALELLKQAYQNNPYADEIAFNYLRLTRAAGPDQIEEILSGVLELFPRDFRFLMIKLGTLTEPGEITQFWSDILDLLEISNEAFRSFYEELVVERFCGNLQKNKSIENFEDAAQRLEQIYPENGYLHFVLGQVLEQEGLFEKALPYFEKVRQMHKSYKSNQKFLSTLQVGFVESYCNALQTRLDETF